MKHLSFSVRSFFVVLSLFATLAACGEQVAVEQPNTGGGGTGGTAATGLDLGASCTCPADAGNSCTSCAAGLTCFAPQMHSGVCTRACTSAIDGGSGCPAAFTCHQSALDDYATGPWCL